MNRVDLSPDSYWLQTDATNLHLPPFAGNRRVDVAIIGAGITGLTAAMYLKQTGKEVAIVEACRVGSGTTGGTSAHLDVMPDQGMKTLIRDFGEDAARKITNARQMAIRQIEEWVDQLGIDCDFRRVPAYAYTEHDDHQDRLRKEFEASQSIGLPVTYEQSVALPYAVAGGFRIEGQARFHSVKYLHGLARHLHGDGVRIYEMTRAEPPEDGCPCRIKTNGGELLADKVILATHSAYLGVSQFDMRQGPYQSYMVAVRVRNGVPDALLWDDDEPYHYLRWAASDDPHLLLVGGADHKTGQGDEREHFQQLIDYVHQRFDVDAIERQWSAEFFEPSDGVPFIGRVPRTDNLYLATGFSGTGLTYGTAAGKILANMVLDLPTDDAEPFSPSRIKPVAAAKEFISENINVAKHFVADRFQGETLDSLDDVPMGEGRLVRYEGEQCAVYRDEQNQLHILSPECTHSGCYVQWNNAEKTWDCPCHGGRYAATGERLYGPPPSDLEQKSVAHV